MRPGLVPDGTFTIDGPEMRCLDNRDVKDHDWHPNVTTPAKPRKHTECLACGAVAELRLGRWWVDWPLADIPSGWMIERPGLNA